MIKKKISIIHIEKTVIEDIIEEEIHVEDRAIEDDESLIEEIIE